VKGLKFSLWSALGLMTVCLLARAADPVDVPDNNPLGLSADVKTKMASSVSVTSQAEAFETCGTMMASYGVYFQIENDKVFGSANQQLTASAIAARQKMSATIKDCLNNPTRCMSDKDKYKEFMAYLSLLSRAKDIRRVILECNTNYINMQSVQPTLAEDNIRIAQYYGKDISGLSDVTLPDANKGPPKAKFFKFDKDVVNAVSIAGNKISNKMTAQDFGKELDAYKNFALLAMTTARPAAADYTEFNAASVKSVPLSQNGDPDGRDIISFNDPSKPAGANRVPSSITNVLLDQGLDAGARAHESAVTDIVAKFQIAQPTTANIRPDALGNIEEEASKLSSSLPNPSGQDRDNYIDRVDREIDAKVKEKTDALAATATAPNQSNVVTIIAEQESFRTFLNDIWKP
jgi:hypothetical protein